MTLFRRTAVVALSAFFTLCLLSPPTLAKPAFSAKEKKSCTFCHVGKPGDRVFTKAGEYYQKNQTLKGFAEAAPAKEAAPPAKEAAAPAPKPEPSVPPPMKETMKAHLEEMRKSVEALREDEKKLEGLTDPVEFRKAAIGHFRMLDDLQESHLKHMESMMDRMHKGGAPMGHDCPCAHGHGGPDPKK